MSETAARAELLANNNGFFDPLNRLTPQAVFLLVAFFFGLITCFVTPPLQSPDEPFHWFRVYEISQGRVLSRHYGGDIPVSMQELKKGPPYESVAFNPSAKVAVSRILQDLKRPLLPRDCRFVLFPSESLYSIVPYWPSALGMFLARKLQCTALSLLYAGRVGNLLGYLLIGWLAIRTMPILKWPAAMILCSPLALFLAAAVSADPITNAMAMLATAFALRCIVTPQPVTARMIMTLTLLMMAVALCKAVYFPIALLALAVPRTKWGGGYRRWVIPTAIVLLTIATAVVWSKVVDADHVIGERGNALGAGMLPQRAWVFQHKAEFMRVIWRSVTAYFPSALNSTFGQLGWLDTQLQEPVITFIYVGLIWLCVAYDEPIQLPAWPRAVAAGAFLSGTFLILTATYLVWDGLGDPIITGVTGRYFLPIALLLCVVIRRRGRYPVQPKWMLAMLASISLYTVWVEIERYYLVPGALFSFLSGGT